MKDPSKYSRLILRVGLGGVFLWFGSSEVLNPVAWLSVVPNWLQGLSTTFIQVHGLVELVIAISLLIGFRIREFASLAALMLVTIIAAVGYSDIAVRDFGLLLASISLALSKEDEFTYKVLLRK